MSPPKIGHKQYCENYRCHPYSSHNLVLIIPPTAPQRHPCCPRVSLPRPCDVWGVVTPVGVTCPDSRVSTISISTLSTLSTLSTISTLSTVYLTFDTTLDFAAGLLHFNGKVILFISVQYTLTIHTARCVLYCTHSVVASFKYFTKHKSKSSVS